MRTYGQKSTFSHVPTECHARISDESTKADARCSAGREAFAKCQRNIAGNVGVTSDSHWVDVLTRLQAVWSKGGAGQTTMGSAQPSRAFIEALGELRCRAAVVHLRHTVLQEAMAVVAARAEGQASDAVIRRVEHATTASTAYFALEALQRTGRLPGKAETEEQVNFQCMDADLATCPGLAGDAGLVPPSMSAGISPFCRQGGVVAVPPVLLGESLLVSTERRVASRHRTTQCPAQPSCRVFLAGLPKGVDGEMLVMLCGRYGDITSTKVEPSETEAFVCFNRIEEAAAAIESLHNLNCMGYQLEVRFAPQASERSPVCSKQNKADFPQPAGGAPVGAEDLNTVRISISSGVRAFGRTVFAHANSVVRSRASFAP